MLAIEKTLAVYHHLYALNYLIFRVANPFGRFQSPFRKQGVIAAFIYRALQGGPLQIWGTGDVIRDFIHIDDVVSALIEGIRYAGPYRCMNVGSGSGRSINQIVQGLEHVLGRGELAIVRENARSSDVPISVLDISLITRETEWRPKRAWFDGLRDTVEWMSLQVKMGGDVPLRRSCEIGACRPLQIAPKSLPSRCARTSNTYTLCPSTMCSS